jgi:hypothetical protein
MTRTLSQERYQSALSLIDTVGRPLDAALLRWALGAAGPEPALVALSAYQNRDGGFGNGLEPDVQSPASSAIATSVALRFLVRLGAPASQPMVAATLDWLDRAIDRERGVWPIITADVDQAPHAPWWSWSEHLAQSWNGFRFNPTAEILAWLHVYRERAPDGLVEAAEAGMRQTLDETPLIEGAYDLKCAARLAEGPATPRALADAVRGLVQRSLAAHDPQDEHLSVLELAPTPTSLFADALAGRAAAALDGLIETQAADGGWPLFWDWSFVDAKAWTKAKSDWRGWLTREAIETLVAYGRVAAR